MNHDPWTRLFAMLAVVLLVIILAWALLASARRPSIDDRLDRIENQLTVNSCLILIPIEDRVARGVAECQLQPEGP